MSLHKICIFGMYISAYGIGAALITTPKITPFFIGTLIFFAVTRKS